MATMPTCKRLLLLLILSGCNAISPQPEPPFVDTGRVSVSGKPATSGEAASPTDGDGAVQDVPQASPPDELEGCDAIPVIGAPGSVVSEGNDATCTEIVIRNETSGVEVLVPINEDGGFEACVSAEAGEVLTLQPICGDSDTESVVLDPI